MVSFAALGSPFLFLASFLLSVLVLAYRWDRTPSVRRVIDTLRDRWTAEHDWRWLRLWHLLVPLVVLTAANIVWSVSTVQCADDSFAILASGQAALHGGNPFLVSYCGGSMPDQIPYGLAEVALNALGATAGSVAGVWLVWQLLALAVVPLVWAVSGADRRYRSVLVGCSILYLPNIATNIGVENAIVPVSVLAMVFALSQTGRRATLWKGLAAFLSTARFPALFPLLGASSSLRRGRLAHWILVLGLFLGCAGLAYALWGWDAINIVYLGQFSRTPAESLNLFALLLLQGWLHPSLVSAAVQGALLLALVLFPIWRGYSTLGGIAIPLVGVVAISQYLTYHFVVWLVPVLLLGPRVNGWLLAYGTAAFLDETYGVWYLGLGHGVWWPYELAGVLLTVLLLALLVRIVREEEARRAPRVAPT